MISLNSCISTSVYISVIYFIQLKNTIDMNSTDVLQCLLSIIDYENIIKVFEGNLFCVFFIQIVFIYINTCTSKVKLSMRLVSDSFTVRFIKKSFKTNVVLYLCSNF